MKRRATYGVGRGKVALAAQGAHLKTGYEVGYGRQYRNTLLNRLRFSAPELLYVHADKGHER